MKVPYLFFSLRSLLSLPYSSLSLSLPLVSFLFFLVLKVLTIWFLLQIFRILMRINVRVLFILALLGLGAVFYVGARTSPIIVFVFTVCIISFLISIYLTKWVLSKDEGPPEMVQVQLGPMSFALVLIPLLL